MDYPQAAMNRHPYYATRTMLHAGWFVTLAVIFATNMILLEEIKLLRVRVRAQEERTRTTFADQQNRIDRWRDNILQIQADLEDKIVVPIPPGIRPGQDFEVRVKGHRQQNPEDTCQP